ncbi:glycosyltransferase family 4 protein [Sphingomonas sinipercae]|uniref:glycosyltransferase family 4 protein n=1 Tax=Sphingomonas sinipercae TaxID=2714944 RepID=UPI00248359EE|nr:glycosyltransferase family 1 protein [Sphingomonas sinipercae]
MGRYCLELANRLPSHRDVESLTMFRGDREVRTLLDSAAPRTRWRKFADRFARPRDERPMLARSDVVHGPNYMLPEWAETGVVTIHDLSVFRFPEMHPPERVANFEREMRRSVERASHLITDCETIRQEVIAFTGFAPDLVTAVPLGIAPSFRPMQAAERAPILRRHGLPPAGYGLTLSSLEPRKRIDRLLSAWRRLPDALRQRFPLAIAGASGWKNDALHHAIRMGADEGWVIPLGFVSEDELPAIYAGAALFLYPSIYEGFGLPPLEAMASGVPTVVAGGSCLAEVTKGGAMLVEPDDADAFAQAIVQALEDEEWRRIAVSSGIQIAAGYTWETCVDRTVDVYQRVVSGAKSAA